MDPALNAHIANTILDDRIRSAAQERRARRGQRHEVELYDSVTVRLASNADDCALHRLEELEGRMLPHEPTLVAEVDGRILAARTLTTRHAVADPFRPTQQLVEMLDLRSVQLREQPLHRASARVSRIVRTVTAPIRS